MRTPFHTALMLTAILALSACIRTKGAEKGNATTNGRAEDPIVEESRERPTPHGDTTAPGTATDGAFFEALPSDVPAVGRSLFDYRMARRADGTSDEWVIDVPYPFTELQRKLFNDALPGRFDTRTLRSNSALIPRGRSLQRHANAADRFGQPRVVIGFDRQFPTLSPLAGAERVGTVLGSRLYVAYSEAAQQLEIISYNEALGRFEFQVVHDYAPPPAVPKLRYARRSLCVSCHQNEGPIFSNALWAETNDNPAIAMLIEEAHAGQTQYQGVPIDVSQLRDVTSLDDSIRTANLIIPHQAMWRDGCKGEPADAVRCRGHILKEAFANVWGVSTQRRVPFNWTQDWESLAEAAMMPTSRIVDIEGLQIPGRNGGIRASRRDLTGDDLDQVRNLVVESPEPTGELDPLTRRTDKDLDNPNGQAFQFRDGTGGGFGKLVVFTGHSIESAAHQTLREAAGRDLGRLFAAIDAVVTKTINGETDVLDGRPFSGGNVAQALMRELDPQWPYQFCCGEEAPPLPAAVMDESDAQAVDIALAPFKEHCGACHTSAGPMGFLAGDDEAVLQNLRAKSDAIIARLTWETPGVVPMPPTTSTQYATLNKPENAGVRLKMIVTLRAD